jgi:hypothetical protein
MTNQVSLQIAREDLWTPAPIQIEPISDKTSSSLSLQKAVKNSISLETKIIRAIGSGLEESDIIKSIYNFRNYEYKQGSLRLLVGLTKITLLFIGVMALKGGLHTTIARHEVIDESVKRALFTYPNGTNMDTVEVGFGLRTITQNKTFTPGWLLNIFGAQPLVQTNKTEMPIFATEAFELTEQEICGALYLDKQILQDKFCVSSHTHITSSNYKADNDYWKKMAEISSRRKPNI